MSDESGCFSVHGDAKHVFTEVEPGVLCECGEAYLDFDLNVRPSDEQPCWDCAYSGGGDDSCFDCPVFSTWFGMGGQELSSNQPEPARENQVVAFLLIVAFAVLIAISWYIGLQLAGPKIFSAAVGLAALVVGIDFIVKHRKGKG